MGAPPPALPESLTPDRLDRLLRPLAAHERILLAVSGGADSIALMHLVGQWRRRSPAADIRIATIDHRLRPESAEEARRVAAMSAAGGFERHVTLVWNEPRPSSGIQAAAREARYRLLRDYATAHGITAIVTAHTAGDQAETVLMRLSRGSGIDGLGGMQVETPLDDTITLVRPLLDIAKPDLVAFLRSIGADWIEDPSNANEAFERVRWRAARSALEELGLTDEALTTTARRVARARSALDATAARLLREAGARAIVSPLGYALFARDWLAGLEIEFRLRTLGACIGAFGGESAPVPLASLEAAVERLDALPADRSGGFTLHGAQIEARDGNVQIARERIGARGAGQPSAPGEPLVLAPSERVVWDNRFVVSLSARAATPMQVAALSPQGLAEMETTGWRRPPGVPALALWALPALRHAGRIMAVPSLGYCDPAFSASDASCVPHRPPFSRILRE